MGYKHETQWGRPLLFSLCLWRTYLLELLCPTKSLQFYRIHLVVLTVMGQGCSLGFPLNLYWCHGGAERHGILPAICIWIGFVSHLYCGTLSGSMLSKGFFVVVVVVPFLFDRLSDTSLEYTSAQELGALATPPSVFCLLCPWCHVAFAQWEARKCACAVCFDT